LRKFCNILSLPLLLTIGVSVVSQGSQAQVVLKDRITQPIENASMTPIAGSLHPMAKTESDQGLADNTKVLGGVTINFQRTAQQEASLQALLQAQQDPGSPSYHKWLTPAQFGQQFGMTAADIAQVTAWLQQQGFTVTSTAASSNAIFFSGSVAAAERAFQTEIHNYSVNGETHFANSTQISIPSALAGIVGSVRGLNDFRPKPRLQRSKLSPHFTSGISGSHFLSPGDIAVIYDLNPLTGGVAASGPYTGKGVTLAVVGQTDIVPADITDFRAAAGLPTNDPTVFTVPGTTPPSAAAGAASGDLLETDTDLEWSGGVAPAASVVLVTSDNVFSSLQYAIQFPINGITIPIISQSYGECESGLSTSDWMTIDGFLAQSNAQGQTIFLAAGDTGAADCDNSTNPNSPIISATQGLAVDYPGSSVYVTDVGGTEFMGDGTAAAPQTGAGTYWSANGSNDVVTSAKSYIPEMVWNDTTFSINNGGGFSAGGGGASALFKKPSWQTGVPGIPADGFRDVPDIALDASVYHDSYLVCSQTLTDGSPNTYVSSCQSNSFRLSDPGQQDDQTFAVTAGGTSFAAPEFAGLLSIIEQKVASGGGLGNINPSLYKLASNATTYASAFHDITTGNNQVPCTTGSPNCPSGSNPVIGFVAATGYDQTTGIGTVDANNLATAVAALVTATGTKTTLTASPGTSLAINEAVTFTATVAPNTVSVNPTGTVTFFVDGSAQTPVAISGSAPFIATYKTDFATAGTHTVSATYSGDNTYTGSTGSSVTLTIVASGTQPTTTAVTANPTTIPLGSAVTLNATVSGSTAGTLTGPVTFTTNGKTIGTVNQVTLGPGNTATASLPVTAATASLGFTPGSDTITATYGGDSFNAGSSGTVTVTVTNPSITVAATNVTISSPSPGNTGTSTITLTSTGGYTGTANLSATSATSLNISGTISPASVALTSGGTGTATLTFTTVAASGNVKKGLGGRVAIAGGTVAGCILLLLIPGIRRKRWPVALVMLVFLSVGAGLGCGGGTGGGVPAGTYAITVTAVDSSNTNITGSTTFNLVIN
jgi:Pro-kumamolisin, activation domain/Bacterial Ig-like domain (group 3)